MIEFWAVVGLAGLDHVFLEQLTADPPHVERTVHEFGFRLSRYEMGELKRLLRIPRVVMCLHAICQEGWEWALEDARPCWWSAAKSAAYDRALPAGSKSPDALVARPKAQVPPKGQIGKRANADYIHPLTNRAESEEEDGRDDSHGHGGSGPISKAPGGSGKASKGSGKSRKASKGSGKSGHSGSHPAKRR